MNDLLLSSSLRLESRGVINGDFSANDLPTILIRCIFSIMVSNRAQPALLQLRAVD